MSADRASSVALSADLAEVATARRFVRSHLADVDEQVAADAQLVTSELVTNAIEHGTGDQVTVCVHVGGADVEVTVESIGPSPDVGPADQWRLADAESIDGRGLGIVRAVASDIAVTRSDDRLTISARLTS